MRIRTPFLLTPHSLLLTVLVGGCSCRPQPATTNGPRPNVVFVSFDALQAAHVGAHGYHRDTTPTIDSVARKGHTFTNVRSVSSWTVPASMTWFTGVYPSEHRMVNKFALYRPPARKLADLRELAPHLVTLASLLRDNGYATAGFTGNAGVSGGFGYEHGFDTYYAPTATFGQFDESIPRALAWLREPRDRPFFLFLHGYDVHGQATPAGGFDYRYVEPGYDRRFTGSEQEQELLREEGLDRGHVTLRPEDVRFWRAVYDEKVRRADDRFKEFLAEFDRLGLADNTLFILTADHGTELHEHRRFDHGFTLYDELLRVPLIFRLPGQTTGTMIPDRVSSIDVMPTILDLLGVPMPEAVRDQLQGTSLVPAMNGQRAGRDIFAETDYREYTFKRAIIDPGGWKLIYTLETKTRELYDLTADPGEQRDLAAAAVEKARADELERRLFKHFADLGHDLGKRRWEIGLNPVYASQGVGSGKK
jgi:choline-sulfatase